MESQQPNNQSPEVDNSLEANQQKISGIWENGKSFITELLDIRKDSDRDETIESVRKDISFQGHNAWILIFSILIASIGLNANSTAVVIGAMLISPLMGPIVGMGLGTAINDDTMLRRSWINLLVMVGLSLLTASLYFLITPFKEITPELEARTYPTLLDVLIAISGGLALIVAKAKKGTISNAIAGVAIATALMPPLCTAGYGIAIWNLSYFGGAMYLFCINTVFIALSTFLVSKLLRFPMVKYANQAKRKQVSRWATLIGVLVLLPSVYLFWQLLQDQVRESEALAFATEYVKYDNMRSNPEWDKETNTLEVVLMGAPVPEVFIEDWTSRFKAVKELEGSKIKFYQGSAIKDSSNEDVALVQEELIDQLKVIQDKDTRIVALENEIKRMNNAQNDFERISEEVRLNYPDISSISFANSVNKDFITQQVDTVAVYNIRFADSTLTAADKNTVKQRLVNWLSYRLKTNAIKINEVADGVKVNAEVVE